MKRGYRSWASKHSPANNKSSPESPSSQAGSKGDAFWRVETAPPTGNMIFWQTPKVSVPRELSWRRDEQGAKCLWIFWRQMKSNEEPRDTHDERCWPPVSENELCSSTALSSLGVISSLKADHKLVRQVLSLFLSFYRWEKWSSEGLSNCLVSHIASRQHHDSKSGMSEITAEVF